MQFLRANNCQLHKSRMGSLHIAQKKIVWLAIALQAAIEMTLRRKSKLSEIEQGFANMKAGKTQRSGIVFSG